MPPASEFDDFKQRVRVAVEERLTAVLAQCAPTETCEVAKYAVLGGGHRWRGMVAIAAGTIFADDAFEINLPGACAVELAHGATLLLDDLPSMDDAPLRRGKACAHRVFPAWAVDMAPAFLVTLAFDMTLQNPLASYERRVIAALEVSRAGLQMVEGQEMDVTQSYAPQDEPQLLACYRLKSAGLYAAAAKAGAILCGASDTEALRLYDCGFQLGLSYQYLDDVADVVAPAADVGKVPGRDSAKVTAVSLLGLEGATARSREFQIQGLSCLAPFDRRADLLRQLVTQASWAPH